MDKLNQIANANATAYCRDKHWDPDECIILVTWDRDGAELLAVGDGETELICYKDQMLQVDDATRDGNSCLEAKDGQKDLEFTSCEEVIAHMQVLHLRS